MLPSIRTIQWARWVASRLQQRAADRHAFSRTATRIATATLATGIAIALLSFAVLLGFKSQIQQKLFAFHGHARIIKFSNNRSFEPPPLDTRRPCFDTIRQLPGIHHTQRYIEKAAVLRANDEVLGVVLKGIGQDFDSTYFAPNLIAGRLPARHGSKEALEVVVSEYIANTLRVQTGDTLLVAFIQQPPRFRKMVIVGIYDTGLSLFDEHFLLTDIRLLQKLNGWDAHTVTGVEVFLKDFDTFPRFFPLIDELLDMDLYLETAQSKHFDMFDWLILLDNNVWVLLGIIVAVIGFNLISVLFILIVERTSMIGLLKAMGAGNRQIKSIFVWQGLRIALAGLAWGNLLGIGLATVQYFFRLMPLDRKHYFMDYVPIQWNWLSIVGVNIGALVIVFLLLWLAAGVIARIRPIKAIRFD
ncbi:ABC transporter permease [Thermonema rossianum]|uniref:ABC transporter permease n=1 Tax=Thermonema rossianum TaxID=55505 RepID=UPI00068EEA3F|nr:FtsX-like permease family protein [Thermonema rossianum]